MSPFGVGSLCEIDGQSFFVRGTGSWKGGNNLEEIKVGTLADKLKPRKLMQPKNSVAITRFPRWHFCPECRKMEYWTFKKDQNSEGDRSFERPVCDSPTCSRARLVPMRFVAACENGHMDEIDWYRWAHRDHQDARNGTCDRPTAKLYFEVTGRSGGDFSSMEIRCECGSRGSLEGIAGAPLGACRGHHPGENEPSTCIDVANSDKPKSLFMEPRGSSALHYASIVSALDIDGEVVSESWVRIRNNGLYQSALLLASSLDGALPMEQKIAMSLPHLEHIAGELDISCDEVRACFIDDLEPEAEETMASSAASEIDQKSIFDTEFPVLARPEGQQSSWLITRPEKPSSRFGFNLLFQRFVRVERLREVRAFQGFQRLKPNKRNPIIPPSLGRPTPEWLPATMVLGEGVFVEFSNAAIEAWRKQNHSEIDNFTEAHLIACEAEGLPDKFGFNPNPTFIMVHTFAHLLLNQLSFDCGYSSTSLRERIYCGSDAEPYAGVLIYTADSDAEGSMGGLSEMGAPNKLEDVIYRAVSRGQWCSGDPVCRELEAQGIGGLNRAACHACSLVAETSCTHQNSLLNRVLVSGDGRENGRGVREPIGFFHGILET